MPLKFIKFSKKAVSVLFNYKHKRAWIHADRHSWSIVLVQNIKYIILQLKNYIISPIELSTQMLKGSLREI